MKTTRKAWLRAGKRLLPRGRCVSNHLLSGLAVKIARPTMISAPLSSGARDLVWGTQVAGFKPSCPLPNSGNHPRRIIDANRRGQDKQGREGYEEHARGKR